MISPGEASRIARKFQGQLPVDVFALARELGLGPVRDSTLPKDISGMIRRRPDGEWEIVVNDNHSRARQRFTVAHEIAHFIYHRNRLEAADGTSDNLAYRRDGKLNDNKEITWLQEFQANQYASNLLVPQHHLQQAIAEGLTEEQMAGRFDVSPAAMRIKLGKVRERPTPPIAGS